MTARQAKVLFGEFELDLSSGELHRGGERLANSWSPIRVRSSAVKR